MAEVSHLPADPSHKKVALLIAVLALILAFAETLAKGAQTTALSTNIEAANLWAFFQAKTIRMTAVRTAAEAGEITFNAHECGVAPSTLRRKQRRW